MRTNFFYYLLPSAMRGVLGVLFMIPFMTYYLEPVDFGVSAIIIMIASFVTPLSSSGSSYVLSANYYSVDNTEKGELVFDLLIVEFVLSLFWSMIFAIVFTFLLPIIISEYKPVYKYYFYLSLVGILFNGIWPTISITIILKKSAKTHSRIEIGQYFATIITTVICLIYIEPKIIALFVAPVVSGIFSFIFGLVSIKNDFIFQFRFKWVKEIFRYGMPTIPGNVVELICNSIDKYFIQRWINLAQLGIYVHSQSYRALFNMGQKAFGRVFSPEALETYSKRIPYDELYKMIRLWTNILGVSGIGIALFSREIVSILTHGKFTAAGLIVPIWFLMTFFNTWGRPFMQFLLFEKKVAFIVKSRIALNIIFVGINILSVYYFGIIGAAVSFVASNFVVHLAIFVYARVLGFRFRGMNILAINVVAVCSAYVLSMMFGLPLYYKIVLFCCCLSCYAFIILRKQTFDILLAK